MWILCLSCSGFCLNLLNAFSLWQWLHISSHHPHPPHPWVATFQLISSFPFKATWSLSQKLTVQVAHPCLNSLIPFLLLLPYKKLHLSLLLLWIPWGQAYHTPPALPSVISFPIGFCPPSFTWISGIWWSLQYIEAFVGFTLAVRSLSKPPFTYLNLTYHSNSNYASVDYGNTFLALHAKLNLPETYSHGTLNSPSLYFIIKVINLLSFECLSSLL